MLLSLFTDRRSEDEDGERPDRRGWWADGLAEDGDRFGSRLWLLAREKETAAVLSRAEEYAREALAWLVEDLVAERVEVAASIPRRETLALVVTIYRPTQDPARYRFGNVWAAMEG